MKNKSFLFFLLLGFVPITALILSPFGYTVSLFGIWDLSVIVAAVWVLAAITVTAFYLIIKSDISEALRITGIITASVFSAILLCLSVFIVFAGQFTEKTVVNRILSPESIRFAEIVDSDQGALGGNTVIYVKDTHKTDFLLFSIGKSKRIYVGEWKEYENMKIYWKDENYLVINSEEYAVK